MTADSIYKLSDYIQWFGSFLIVIFCFLKFPKRPLVINILGFYGLGSFIFQLLQFLSRLFFESRFTSSVGNIYVLFEALILLFLFGHILKNKNFRLIMVVAGILVTILFAVVISQEIKIMSSTTRTVRDFIMICCSIIYFFTLLKELPQNNLFILPTFWFVSAILFFFSCTFILSLSLKYLIELLGDDFIYFWAFRNFLRAGFCLVLCFGIWKAKMSQNDFNKDSLS
jgi:hypothetical protein